MVYQALAEVVRRPQLEMSLIQTVQPQRIAHLHVVAEVAVHLFVCPPVAVLEDFQPQQNVDRELGRDALSL